MWQKFYVTGTVSGEYIVWEDSGPGSDTAKQLATFQTEWAANEFCRFCAATEPKSYGLVIPNPYGLIISNNGVSGFTTTSTYNLRTFSFGSIILAKFDSTGKVEDLFLGRLVGYWIKLKYQKHVKPVLIKIWYGEKHGSK